MQTAIKTPLLGVLLATLAGCATLDGPTEPHDPWEGFNRSMHTFNDKLDRAVLRPVARGYRAVTPDAAERGISNFFSNLGEVKTLVNDLLQLKPLKALSSTGRLLINSTIGIGGLFDVATPMGLEKHQEDFGQTLGRWGVGTGPYLVLPFFGPSTVRDGSGLPVDAQLYPVREVDDREARYGLYALDVVSGRAELLEAGDILDEAAYDRYVYMREFYLQRRRNLVHDGQPPPEELDEEIDIFSDD